MFAFWSGWLIACAKKNKLKRNSNREKMSQIKNKQKAATIKTTATRKKH